MSFFVNAVDRFCARHPRFGIRNLMLYIIVGQAIVYLFTMMDTTNSFVSLLLFNPSLIIRGQIWRIVTFVFIPQQSSLIWMALFLYFYYFIGNTLENAWGSGKFTIYYFSGVAFTLLYALLACAITGSWGYVGISSTYINMAMFFAFASLYPEQRVLFMFFIPIKIKWLAVLDAVFFLVEIVTGSFPLNLLPLVAVLNYLLFFAPELVSAVRRTRGMNSAASRRFRDAKQRAEYRASHAPYRFKCAVCGRTDTEYPNLEFRYCSRCAGYHCFCEDHINSHVHFTE